MLDFISFFIFYLIFNLFLMDDHDFSYFIILNKKRAHAHTQFEDSTTFGKYKNPRLQIYFFKTNMHTTLVWGQGLFGA
jgi:hypothetical protein